MLSEEIRQAVAEILKENQRRLDTVVNVPFNSISGFGSVGKRVKVVIDGFPIRKQWLPVKMMSVPLVRKLAEYGDLDRFISETIKEDYTDEDRLKVIDAFVRVRSRHDSRKSRGRVRYLSDCRVLKGNSSASWRKCVLPGVLFVLCF